MQRLFASTASPDRKTLRLIGFRIMVNKCECEGCVRFRKGHDGYKPCAMGGISPSSAAEFLAKGDPRIGGGSDAICLAPLVIFFFSVGMAVGKYWL